MKAYVWKLVDGHKKTVFEYLMPFMDDFEKFRSFVKRLVVLAKMDFDGIDIVKGDF